MSNCIELYPSTRVVVFTAEEIDLPVFRVFVEGAKKQEGDWDNRDWEQDAAWWFLQENSEFTDQSVEITFGVGRSTHTNRDFMHLVKVISKFIKTEKKHSCHAADECDQFESEFYIHVDFKVGTVE